MLHTLHTDQLFYSLRDAARALGIAEKTLRNQICRGTCPLRSVTFGRRRLVPKSEIDRILNAATDGKGGAA